MSEIKIQERKIIDFSFHVDPNIKTAQLKKHISSIKDKYDYIIINTTLENLDKSALKFIQDLK